jgi:hypothetical protein
MRLIGECVGTLAALWGRGDHSVGGADVKRDTTFICPNPKCDYRGKPNVENYGSLLAFVVLLLLGVLPGILYAVFKTGRKYVCPKCKIVLDRD